MNNKLNTLPSFAGIEGPVLTIVMDGIGIAPANAGKGAEPLGQPMGKRIHIPLRNGIIKQKFNLFVGGKGRKTVLFDTGLHALSVIPVGIVDFAHFLIL